MRRTFGPAEGQRLRGQDVGDLAGADAERDVAEGAVRAGVAVAADERDARLREAQLGPDDVHDPLAGVGQVEQADAELAAIAFDGRHHLLGQAVGERAGLVIGGDDVVDGGQRPLGVHHLEPAVAEHGEGLGAGDFVDQVLADKELRLPRRQLADGVGVPDFVEQIATVRHVSLLLRIFDILAKAGCGARGEGRGQGAAGRRQNGEKVRGRTRRVLLFFPYPSPLTLTPGDGRRVRRPSPSCRGRFVR